MYEVKIRNYCPSFSNLNAGPVEEAYKVLRANIQFCGIDSNRTITVTSCAPGEGKTNVSANLAMSMAKSGIKVLLVDADLRKPSSLKEYGRDCRIGLSNILAGRLETEEAIYTTNLDNFYYLACGPKPPNPAELVSSQRFAEFVQKVRMEFDIVIIDTPPLGGVIDAALIASMTDGVIIVMESGKAKQDAVRHVKEQLEKSNARILGAVLNKIKRGDYKSYYNYNYHYTSEKIKKGGKLAEIFKIFGSREKKAV